MLGFTHDAGTVGNEERDTASRELPTDSGHARLDSHEEGLVTREEFGNAVRALLTDEQRIEIDRLHDLVEDDWATGCAAHQEDAACCIDMIRPA